MRVKIFEDAHWFWVNFGNNDLTDAYIIRINIDEEDGRTNHDFVKVECGTDEKNVAVIESVGCVSREDRRNAKTVNFEDISVETKIPHNFATDIFSI